MRAIPNTLKHRPQFPRGFAMQSQQNFKLTATPQGILLGNAPLNKRIMSALPARAARHIACADELISRMKPEEWGPPKPHGPNDVPILAMVKMHAAFGAWHLALANAGALNKFDPNQPRDSDGRWTSGNLAAHHAMLEGERRRVIQVAAANGRGGSDTMAGNADTTDPAIEALDLSPTARAGAYELKRQFPAIVFTSGRRSKSEQADAMAGNVVLNRNWIEETYIKSDIRDKCQEWVDNNPDKKSKKEIAAGILGVFNAFADSDLSKISKHLSGDAFDVQPVDKDADAIKAAIKNLPDLTRFLESEGGLVRWHIQF
jgi:hypothetical protein